MVVMLLLAGCGKKTYTVQDFAGKWKLYGLSTYGEENLANFGEAVRKHLGGGISINGERICLLYDLQYEILACANDPAALNAEVQKIMGV